MEPIFERQDLVNLVLNLLFYFIIGSFGAFVKDLYGTLTKKDEHIRLGKIFVGATCATFICVFFQEYFDLKITTIVPVTFLLGVLGFEIFGNITSIDKLKKFTIMVVEFKKFTSQRITDSSERTHVDKNSNNTTDSRGSKSYKDPPEENDVETRESQNKKEIE